MTSRSKPVNVRGTQLSDRDPHSIAPLPSRSGPLSHSRLGQEDSSLILIADDNADMREYVKQLLCEHYEVIPASDGESALEIARERRPDLILSDIMMPRLGGFELLRRVRADVDLKSIPVILLSARAGEDAQIEGLDAGADDYLAKPFSARELQARVRSHLAIARARRESAQLGRAAQLNTERLAAVVTSSDDAIITKNLDGTITTWNKAAERIFGHTAEEAVGHHITLIIPPDRLDEESEILACLRRGERVDHFQTVRVRKDGTTVDVSVTISPLKDSGGRIIGASKVARDISAEKRAEEAMRESEARFRQLSETLDVEVRARTKELEERNRDVTRQSEQVRELSWKLMQIQDEERRHIARELHDSAGQTLAVLGMNLSAIVQAVGKSAPEIAESVKQTQQLVQQLTKEIRTTSYLLHPPLLDESGLPAALSWYISGLKERSGLDIGFNISAGFGRLPRDMELVVFRLVQECLTNIHRHSGSKSATIQITHDSDRVLIEVRDQGKGIPPEKLAEVQSKGSGVGFRGMRERLRQFQGEMMIESHSGGTTVVVTIPVSKQLEIVKSTTETFGSSS